MKIWLPDEVEERLIDAARVIRLLPAPRRTRPQGLHAAWPDVVRKASEAYGFHGLVTRPATPLAAEIKLADEAVVWLFFLDGRSSSVVWARANGATWRVLEDLDGASTWTIKRICREGHLTIAGALSAGRQPQGQSVPQTGFTRLRRMD